MSEHAERPPQQKGLMKPFDVLLGEWSTVGIHPELPSAVHGRSTFEWLVEGGLLVWHSDWEPGSRVPNGLCVIGYDDSVDTCTVLYSDDRGVARILHMSLEGGVWKIWRDAPGFSQRTTGIVSPDGNTITCHGELSRDGSTWGQDLDVTYTRKP